MRHLLAQKLILFLFHTYRWGISPWLHLLFHFPGGCRFIPSCSEYSLDAIQKNGMCIGLLLTGMRIFRCHPFAKAGHDPAPCVKIPLYYNRYWNRKR